jgi:hypothetical protein
MDMEDSPYNQDADRKSHVDAINRLSKSKSLLDPTQDQELLTTLEAKINSHKQAITQLKPLAEQLESLQAALTRKNDKVLMAKLQVQELEESIAEWNLEIQSMTEAELVLKQNLRAEHLASDFTLPDTDPSVMVQQLSVQMQTLQLQTQQLQAHAQQQQQHHAQQLSVVRTSLDALAKMQLPEEAKAIVMSVLEPPPTPPVRQDLHQQPGSPHLCSVPSLYSAVASPQRSRSEFHPYQAPTSSINGGDDLDNKENIDAALLSESHKDNTQSPLGEAGRDGQIP